MLQRNARDEVIRNANIMIQAARAIRSYTVTEIRPKLANQLASTFLPQTVPAFAATETLKRLPAKYHDFGYTEATLNPTNPRDRASDWQADLIRAFQQNPEAKSFSGVRQTLRGGSLYIADPIRITDKACLTCHGKPVDAPASLIKLYGRDNGFGWKLNEVVGAQVVSVPTAVATRKADHTFFTFIASLCSVFVVLYVVLNIMLSRMILRPITRMAHAADEVSTGNFGIAEFEAQRKDEIGRLGVAFNRMRRSLKQAMGMIDGTA
ncbi:MAG: DUF3365 domain-containing protein [Arenicellales bacterium]